MKNKRVKQMISDVQTHVDNLTSHEYGDWYNYWGILQYGEKKGLYCLLNNYKGSSGMSVKVSLGTVSIKGKVK